jgi:hypothetical protein
MALDVMLDLETFGLGPTAAIVQIGAVEFDPYCGLGRSVLGRRFQADVMLQSSLALGMTIDAATTKWWSDRGGLQQVSAQSLPTALQAFVSWWKEGNNAQQPTEPGPSIWSNGASFDVPIMQFALKQCGLAEPWHYRNIRDQRTAKAYATLLGQLPGGKEKEPSHDALDDATQQAFAVQRYSTYIMEAGRAKAD